MSNYSAKRDGSCPYCGGTTLIDVVGSGGNPAIQKQQCTTCTKFSARMKRNGTQYPLQTPNDSASSPTVSTRE